MRRAARAVDLQRAVVEPTAGPLGARRVLEVLPAGRALAFANAHRPPGDDGGELLRAIARWLAEAARTS